MSVSWDKKKQCFRWYFDRVIPGGGRVRLTKVLPKSWSAIERNAYDRKQTDRIIAEASGVQPRAHLIADAMARYLEEKCPVLKNGKKAAEDLAHLVPYIDGKVFSELPDVFVQYAADHRHLAPATVRNRLAYLRAAARYAFKYRNIGDADTLMRLVMPKVSNNRTTRIHDDREFARLVDKLDVRPAALATLAYYTGLRAQAEIHTLPATKVKKKKGEVWLECGTTKNGDPHRVFIHPDAAWAVKHIPFDDQTYRWYYDRIKEAAAAIGRPELWVHDLRRSFASDVLSRGGTIDDVQVALNQKSRAAAERYAWLDQSRKKAIFGRFPHTTAPTRRAAKPKKAA